MPTLTDKNILILSPQSWGKMFISKHHYAIELARRGNRVYFLNPPEYGSGGLGSGIQVLPSGIDNNLWLISHRLWFPYILKFHVLPVFHAGMRIQMKRILKRIGRPIDIIWSFDLGNLCPLNFFDTHSYKIFHPVDEPLSRTAIAAAEGSDIILSVTKEILEKYRSFPAPKHFINHGISAEFLQSSDVSRIKGDPVRIGMAGNLLRADIDRKTMTAIVSGNRKMIFECWGSYATGQSNIGGGTDQDTIDFIAALKALPNVILHGAVPAAELAKGFHNMDAFLICYDIKKDQSGGTNYHKIMEYLSTGKVIISNNVTTYKDMPDLMQMTVERDNNEGLPGLFSSVTGNLEEHNSTPRQKKRMAFARSNTYKIQLERIAHLINRTTDE